MGRCIDAALRVAFPVPPGGRGGAPPHTVSGGHPPVPPGGTRGRPPAYGVWEGFPMGRHRLRPPPAEETGKAIVGVRVIPRVTEYQGSLINLVAESEQGKIIPCSIIQGPYSAQKIPCSVTRKTGRRRPAREVEIRGFRVVPGAPRQRSAPGPAEFPRRSPESRGKPPIPVDPAKTLKNKNIRPHTPYGGCGAGGG